VILAPLVAEFHVALFSLPTGLAEAPAGLAGAVEAAVEAAAF
jgi:hypothetical protein